MLDNRHLWMDKEYTIAGYQACWEERLKNNPASECVYGSWEIFGVKEEDTSWAQIIFPWKLDGMICESLPELKTSIYCTSSNTKQMNGPVVSERIQITQAPKDNDAHTGNLRLRISHDLNL